MIVVEVRQEETRRRGDKEEEEEEATDIKSNNPHLAGGEKCFMNAMQLCIRSVWKYSST